MSGYDVVAIGSSWGGLAALERILGQLPPTFAAGIVIAQHRGPDVGVRGALVSYLSNHSALPVCEAGDKEAVERGRVHVAPSDYHLLVESDGFSLSTDEAVHYSRPSIDVLFESVADVYRERAIGVVLTGANDDGADGVAHMRRRGGCTIAQDPATAERPEMPKAAIATGAVQRIVPLDDIPGVLAELCGQNGGLQ